MYFLEEEEAAPPPLPDLDLDFLMAPWAMMWVACGGGLRWVWMWMWMVGLGSITGGGEWWLLVERLSTTNKVLLRERCVSYAKISLYAWCSPSES